MIHYQVELSDLVKIESDLNMLKDKTPYILRGALNKTAKDAEKAIKTKINKEYSATNKKRIYRSVNIQKAAVGNLVAILNMNSPIGETYDFKVSARGSNPKSGHRVNVKRENPTRILQRGRQNGSRDAYKAFVVTFNSGHTTLAQRIPGKPMKSKPWKEAIKKMLAPSVPKMAEMILGPEEGGMLTETNKIIHEALQRNIMNEMNRFLK